MQKAGFLTAQLNGYYSRNESHFLKIFCVQKPFMQMLNVSLLCRLNNKTISVKAVVGVDP